MDIQCFDCKGFGTISFAFSRKPLNIPCDRCNGKGIIDPIMLEWKKIGDAIRLDRIAKRVTLYSEAKRLDCNVRFISHAERGIIDPNTIYPNNDAVV